jgi:hypothetical protein
MLRFWKYGLYAFFYGCACLRREGVRENGEGFNVAFEEEGEKKLKA